MAFWDTAFEICDTRVLQCEMHAENERLGYRLYDIEKFPVAVRDTPTYSSDWYVPSKDEAEYATRCITKDATFTTTHRVEKVPWDGIFGSKRA